MTSATSVAPATQRWVLVLAALASIMTALDTLVVATALPTIHRDLHAGVTTLEWTVNAYNLSFATLLMTAAALGDRFGRTRMFAVGLGIFVFASGACGLDRSAETLIVARAIQGAGAAMILSLAVAIVAAAFPAGRRGGAMGSVQGATGLATACGPLVGGAITQGLTWEWIFWINVPIGLIAIPLSLSRIPETYGPDTKLDLPGPALITGGSFGIVWALVRGNPIGWTSPEVLLSAAAGLALCFAFARWEARTPHPMLPIRLFTARGFTIGNTAIFLTFAALFTAVFFYPQLLQAALHYTPLETGIRLLPWTLALLFCAPLAGTLADRLGERPIIVTGLALMAVGMFWTAATARPGISYAPLIFPLIVAGIGTAMTVPAAQTAAVNAVTPAAMGKAAGANSTMRELGGVFGIALTVAVFTAANPRNTTADFLPGFHDAITTAAALALLGALISLPLPRR
ncbi:MFS transporter [Nocardia sp. NPDC020380]|uniref:MFS transporter n=1 Tax=Nocardia sp. NPDC020380 TaxID=3364309 RepID=UPI0037885293